MNIWISIIWISGLLTTATQALEIARPFGDSMVLPHGRPIPVWGRGEPGSEITVAFAGQSKAVRCGIDGQWQLVLAEVGSSRVDLQACKLEYSIVSPK